MHICFGKDKYQNRHGEHILRFVGIDGVWSTVGSTNMDYLSFLRDDEVYAVILSHEFSIEMEKMFDRDLAESDQIPREEWKKRPVFPRISDWFAHVFSHLM